MEDGNQNATRVYEAVLAGVSAAELRDIIESTSCHGGSADDEEVKRRRLAAVNAPGARPQEPHGYPQEKEELPLAAARRLYRFEHVCVLVEHGAAVEPVFGAGATPLAVVIACGEEHGAEASVRALLRAGADAREPVGYERHESYSGSWRCPWSSPYSTIPGRYHQGDHTCTAAHLCLAPVRASPDTPCLPRLRCLELLVREGGADVNALDSDGLAPLAWLGYATWLDWTPSEVEDEEAWLETGLGNVAEAALDALLALGADPNRCGRGPRAAPPALHWIRATNYLLQPIFIRCLRALAAAGGRIVGVFDGAGDTALLLAARWARGQVVRFLLEELHADVHQPNRATGELPLTCCGPEEQIVSTLLAAGADPNRADGRGRRPLLNALSKREKHEHGPSRGQARAVFALLRAGATIEGVRGPHGEPPFLLACECWPARYVSDDRLRLLEFLFRRTPDADRRATLEDGRSAVDLIAGDYGVWLDQEDVDESGAPRTIADLDGLPDDYDFDDPDQQETMWEHERATMERLIAAHRRWVAELVICGASAAATYEEEREAVDAAVASCVGSCGLPIAARRATRATRELAARRSEARRWRAHDCLVDLALEARDAREADARLNATRARLAALERAAEEAGVGGGEATASGTDEGEDDDE